MNLIIDIAHPGHVHFFRNTARMLAEDGHKVTFFTRHIPVAEKLMDMFGIGYQVLSSKRSGMGGLAIELIEHFSKLTPRLLKSRADIVTAIGGPFIVHAAAVSRCRSIVFTDTDTAISSNKITFPFASRIVTPQVYPIDLGKKHIRYRGFHELAYLHPRYFTPNPGILKKYGLDTHSTYSIVRLCSWEAAHDVGVRATTTKDKVELVKTLNSVGKVIIVPEGNLPEELAPLAIPIEPEDFHHLLHFAHCCVTEGATTASEACILGTPVLYINPLRPCYIYSMAEYGMLRMSLPGENMLVSLGETLELASDIEKCRHRAESIVADNCDVTQFVVNLFEGFS